MVPGMTIAELCRCIELPSDAREQMIALQEWFDIAPLKALLMDFRNYDKMETACGDLTTALGEDRNGMKHLYCMLFASAELYEWYREQGISDEIYIATMKCYPRFLSETRKMRKELLFDRYWWTCRQAGGHLLRIGELEYERKTESVISIHIPSDANLSPAAVTGSLIRAKAFFDRRDGKNPNREYVCHSWLLDPALRGFLPDRSNILAFQKRFSLYDPGEPDRDTQQWIFQSWGVPVEKLPERTSLQRKVKAYLLSGCVIYAPRGRLMKDPQIF